MYFIPLWRPHRPCCGGTSLSLILVCPACRCFLGLRQHPPCWSTAAHLSSNPADKCMSSDKSVPRDYGISCHKWEKSESAHTRPFSPLDLTRHFQSRYLPTQASQCYFRNTRAELLNCSFLPGNEKVLAHFALNPKSGLIPQDQGQRWLWRGSIVNIKVNICQTAISRINNVGVLQPRSPRSLNQWLI